MRTRIPIIRAVFLLTACTTREVVVYEGANCLTACGDAGSHAKADPKADANADAPSGAANAADVRGVVPDASSHVADSSDKGMQASSADSAGGGASTDAGGGAVTDAGGGASTDAGATVHADGGPYLRQWADTIWRPDAGIGPDLYITLNQTLPGSSVLVFATEYNVGGSPPGSGPLAPVTITDSASSSYSSLDNVNSPPDTGGALSYVATNVAPSAALAVHAHFVVLEWTGLIAIEVASASQVVAHGGSEVLNASAGQVMNGPPLSIGSSPALGIALYVNGFDNSGKPGVGSGWASVGGAWNWGGMEGTATIPSALLEQRTATGTITAAAVDLQTSSLQEDFIILSAALR